MSITMPRNEDIPKMSIEELETLAQQDIPEGLKLTITRQLTDLYANSMDMVKFKQKCDELITFAHKSHIKEDLYLAYNYTGSYYLKVHEPSKALEYFQKALEAAKESGKHAYKIAASNSIASLFLDLGKRELAIEMYKECYEEEKQINGDGGAKYAWNIALVHTILEQPEEALRFLDLAEQETKLFPTSVNLNLVCNIYFTRAEVYLYLKEYEQALDCITHCRELCVSRKVSSFYGLSFALEGSIFYEQQRYLEAQQCLEKGLEIHQTNGIELPYIGVHEKLMEVYEALENYAKAYEQSKLINEIQKRNTEKVVRDKALSLELIIEKERQQRAFEKRIAQARLNTMTKIASDIAHEVQNPLQFVNNFSAMNVELVEELNEYVDDCDMEGIKLVGKDIVDNSQKIKDYGVRISKIVDQLLDQTRKAQAGELIIDEENQHDFSKQKALG